MKKKKIASSLLNNKNILFYANRKLLARAFRRTWNTSSNVFLISLLIRNTNAILGFKLLRLRKSVFSKSKHYGAFRAKDEEN